MKRHIAIIDDHSVFIQGLSVLIESDSSLSVIGSATNYNDGLKLIEDKNPELAIVDLNLGEKDGLDLIKDINTRFPKTKILVLSMMQERYYSERALQAGAKGYVMKAEAADTVISAIKAVLDGKIWLSPSEQSRYLDSHFQEPQQATENPIDSLSNRQLQILRLLGQGNGTIEIANLLNISSKTVDAHKEQLKKKLNCKNSQELLRLAISYYHSTM